MFKQQHDKRVPAAGQFDMEHEIGEALTQVSSTNDWFAGAMLSSFNCATTSAGKCHSTS